MRILGIDSGLRYTGWGVIDSIDNHIRFVGCGKIDIPVSLPISERLFTIYQELINIMENFKPESVAIEDIFVNKNAVTSLKLGYARAIALMVPAKNQLPVFEYASRTIKKAVTGSGQAEKQQVKEMVIHFLPGFRDIALEYKAFDVSDALATALCHAYNADMQKKLTDVVKI